MFRALLISLFCVAGVMAADFLRFGEPRGELTLEFTKAVSEAPGAMFEQFVDEDNVPRVDFEEGLRNVVRMARKGMTRMAMSPLDDCEPAFRGNNDDRDEDGLPARGTYFINCETGNEKIEARVLVADENDSARVPEAGFTVDVKSGKGQLANPKKEIVTFQMEPSAFKVRTRGARVFSFGSAFAELGIPSRKTTLKIGFDGDAEMSGSMKNLRAGDRARLSGMVTYKGVNLTGIPDADFVAEVKAEVTFGTCAGDSDVTVVSGKGTLVDKAGNVVAFVVKDCVGTIRFNDQRLKIDGEKAIAMPEANLPERPAGENVEPLPQPNREN